MKCLLKKLLIVCSLVLAFLGGYMYGFSDGQRFEKKLNQNTMFDEQE